LIVTGVQTCALPISEGAVRLEELPGRALVAGRDEVAPAELDRIEPDACRELVRVPLDGPAGLGTCRCPDGPRRDAVRVHEAGLEIGRASWREVGGGR